MLVATSAFHMIITRHVLAIGKYFVVLKTRLCCSNCLQLNLDYVTFGSGLQLHCQINSWFTIPERFLVSIQPSEK